MQKKPYMNIHNSFICISPQLETTKMFFRGVGDMDKQIVKHQ